MKYPVLALSLASIVGANAVEIGANEDWKVTMNGRIQVRAEMTQASDQNGKDYDVWDKDDTPEDFDVYLRRLRLGVNATYKDDTKFVLLLRGDGFGRRAAEFSEDATKYDFKVYYAYGAHTIKDGELKHTVIAGQQVSAANTTLVTSSAAYLLPAIRPTVKFGFGPATGLGYQLDYGVHQFKAVFQNENDDNDRAYSARFQTSFKDAWKGKMLESYLGKPGFSVVSGIDVLERTDDLDNGQESTALTVDTYFHWDQLSATFDIGFRDQTDFAKDKDCKSLVVSAQAGWAMPQAEGYILEPALRLVYVDDDIDYAKEPNVVYASEVPTSGYEVTAGLNCYLDGYARKAKVSLTYWEPENGDADLLSLRIQGQLSF
ncbi:MAG: porin family protein [Planctomycetota bacterium]|jgi:hypothetical protein